MTLSATKDRSPLILVLDIGNSTISINGFMADSSIFHSFIPSTPLPTMEEVCSLIEHANEALANRGCRPEGAIISSVVPAAAEIAKEAFRKYHIEPLDANLDLDLGIEVHTDNPSEVGNDLLCDAIAAKKLFGGDVLIADMGTASKLILISEKGDFEGCCIGAGIGMAKIALSRQTDALPEVSLTIPEKVLGRNTEDSINSCLTYGKAAEIRGVAKQIEKECGRKLRFVLTGGYAALLRPLLPEFEYTPHLVAIGAYEIYRRNCR